MATQGDGIKQVAVTSAATVGASGVASESGVGDANATTTISNASGGIGFSAPLSPPPPPAPQPVRVSKRKRKSRFVKVGENMVLRANNYDLEEGIATFTGSALAKRKRALPKILSAQNAFMFFVRDYRASHGGADHNSAGVDMMKACGSAWKRLDASHASKYHEAAAADKQRFQRESAEREKLLEEIELEEAEKAEKAEKAAEQQRQQEQANAARAAAARQTMLTQRAARRRAAAIAAAAAATAAGGRSDGGEDALSSSSDEDSDDDVVRLSWMLCTHWRTT